MDSHTWLERLNDDLADRYRIKAEVGSGGMATVYLAVDLKHHRDIALKVLKPEVAAYLGPDRFVREIAIAARLSHPRILPLIDSGASAGALYYVTPYVDGDTLRARLDREGPLPVEDALRITEQVAAALDYAHRHQVIHRDIKPDNILLHQGEVLVADFGIALVLDGADGERLTRTGFAVGTPEYMSPEQSTGERDLDARSDVYSLACVLFELLTGEPPYTGPNGQSVIGKRFSDPVPSARRLRATIPTGVDAALQRALARAPADRFETAGAFASALRNSSREDAVVAPSIVVLPMVSLSPDPGDDYFADGLTEELITELSRVRSLRVISRTSAMLLKNAEKSIPSIARQLSVRYALEGTVRRAGDSVRITAQLIDAETDTHLWAERYTGTLASIFEFQEDLARRITSALRVRLSPDEDRRLSARPIRDPRAYDAWLLAMQHSRSLTKEGLERAISLATQALAIIGDNAMVYGGLSWLHCMRYDLNISHTEATLSEAENLAERALQLDPGAGQALLAMGAVRYKRGDMPGWMRFLKRAWEADRISEAASMLGVTLAETGHPGKGREYADAAIERDPLVFLMWATRSWVDVVAGRMEEARSRLIHAAEELAPGDAFAGLWLAQVADYAGDEADAQRHAARVSAMDAGIWSELCELIRRSIARDRGGVIELLGRTTLRDVARTDEQYPLILASQLARVGEHEEALEWLTQSIRWGFSNAEFLTRHIRMLEPLRSYTRFSELVDAARKQAAAYEL